jgi:hypothetical protein
MFTEVPSQARAKGGFSEARVEIPGSSISVASEQMRVAAAQCSRCRQLCDQLVRRSRGWLWDGLLGTLPRPSLSRSTCHAAHDRTKEALTAILPMSIASNDFGSYAALRDCSVWRERNHEG